MNITHLRQFWFGERNYTDLDVHKNYHTVRFAHRPNIDAQIWLSIFSPGARYSDGAVTALGSAAAGVKSYAFENSDGEIEVRTFESWQSHVRVEKAVDITFAFTVRLAWAKAEGLIHYWED